MLGAYLTLAETGCVLGVAAERVRDLIVNGPLIGITREQGLMVHEDDLAAFRRPRPTATTGYFSTLDGSEMLQGLEPAGIGPGFDCNRKNTVDYRTLWAKAPASFQSKRGTMASAAYRALSDLADVQRQGERFLGSVSPEPNTGCHIWTGYVDKHGYGSFKFCGTTVAPHRFVYALERGATPECHDIDHLCRNRWCVNPAHLEAVPHKENIRRRDSDGRDNCVAARAAKVGRHLRLVRP